jgi:hypothetical protein
MTVDFHIDKTRDLLVRTLGGEVTPDEVIDGLEASMKHPDYRPGMPSLIDMRGLASASSSADIRRFAGFLTEHADTLRGMQAALVVSRTVDYGLARMLQAIADDPHVSLAVFYDIGEARQWLGVG